MYDCMVEVIAKVHAPNQKGSPKQRIKKEIEQQRQEAAETKHQRLIREKNIFRICLRVSFLSAPASS